MATFSVDTLKTVVHHHWPDVPIDDIPITPIATGKFNSSYFVRAKDVDIVLRIAPPRDAIFCFYEKDMMHQEADIHGLLRQKTDIPIAQIHVFDDSLALIDRNYMLMERLPGVPLNEEPGVDFNHVLRQVGMDTWHQYIMVDKTGAVTGIIDWDRALWSDPEIEFAVLDYCGISEPAFWEGYGTQRDPSPEARVRQIFYLLYELQKYIVIRQGRNNDRARALQYKQQVFQIIQQTFNK